MGFHSKVPSYSNKDDDNDREALQSQNPQTPVHRTRTDPNHWHNATKWGGAKGFLSADLTLMGNWVWVNRENALEARSWYENQTKGFSKKVS